MDNKGESPVSYDGPPKAFGQPMFVQIDSENFPKGCSAIAHRKAGKVLWSPKNEWYSGTLYIEFSIQKLA